MKAGNTREDTFLALALLCWGVNTTLTKIGLRELDVLALTMVRNSTTLLVLMVIFLAAQRRWPTRPADLGRVLLVALVGVAINQVFYNLSLRYTSAANASLLGSTSPIFGLIIARIFEGERSSMRRWLGAVIGFAGVTLIVVGGRGALSFGLDSIIGDLLMLGCAATWTLFALLGRPLLKVCSATELTLFAYLFGVPLMLPMTVGALIAQPWASLTFLGWAVAIGIGLNNAVANTVFYRAVGKVGASRSMIFLYLTPIAGVSAAVLVLGETLSITQVVGAAVVLLGVNTARNG